MKYDYKTLYEKNAAFYKLSPLRVKILKLLNTVFTWLFAVAYAAFWLYAAVSDKLLVQELVPLFFAPALALILVSAIRLGVDRPRPYSKKARRSRRWLHARTATEILSPADISLAQR